MKRPDPRPVPNLLAAASALALGALVAGGCSGPPGTGDPGGEEVAAVVDLRIEPADPVVTVTPGQAQEIAFTAIAVREDGTEEPTSIVTWTASNASLGTLSDQGVFSTFDDRGGTTYVTARYFDLEATTRLTVVYTQEVDGVELPEGARDLFAGEAVPASEDGPHVVYPYDQVVIPKNQPEIRFMWNPGVGDQQANLFRLTFRSEILDVSVYVDGTSWTADPELWQIISSSNAGGEIRVALTGVRYHVEDGMAVADIPPVAAPEIGIRVDRLDATGSIYYFSASDNGIKRIALDRRGQEDFLKPLSLDAACVSCHVLSPDGRTMALSYHVGETTYAGVVDITGGAQNTTALFSGDPGDILTWSPDGRWLLSNNEGSLYLYSAQDWSRYEVPVPQLVAQPEWSPDGDRIVVVLPAADGFNSDIAFRQGSLAYLRVVGDGEIDPEPVILVESDGITNNYFPTFSPDGEWIAFTRTYDDSSYWSEGSEVWLISKDGGDPIRLDAANGDSGSQNSWPRWGPLSDSDYLWLTFSSVRPYGFFNIEQANPQIWVTAIDEEAARAGVDPSSPPFWLVDQDLDSHNHIPVWGP